MKINYNYIKFSLLAISVVGLCSFATSRNKKRLVSKPTVEFLGSNNLFITSDAVSNLLIQNQPTYKNLTKEALDLNGLEQSLMQNSMISKAEVYINAQGILKAEVLQKQPIARVLGDQHYYIDSKGGYMPLSNNYTERVPFVTGNVSKNKLDTVYKMASFILNDPFLKKQVIEIHQENGQEISLKLREAKFNVIVGTLDHLEKKINNLKAFYIKAIKDKTLSEYKTVNLQFDNQVVCSKI
jgi:cell division protein FtsQ